MPKVPTAPNQRQPRFNKGELESHRGRIVRDVILSICLQIISDAIDENQLITSIGKSLFDEVIQDELITIITSGFTEALEEEERKTIELQRQEIMSMSNDQVVYN